MFGNNHVIEFAHLVKRQDELHEKLITKQSIEELERKANKACRWKGRLWTQEELSWARREAQKLLEAIKWE